MLSSSYPKYDGDVTAPFIESIATGVAALGHEVHMVLPHHPEVRRPRQERGVKFHFYRYAPKKDLHIWGYADSLQADVSIKRAVYPLVPLVFASSMLSLARLTAQEGFDIINAHWVVPNAPVGAVVGSLTGIPLVISLHGSDVFVAERNKAIGRLARASFRRAAGVTGCSHDLLGRAIRLGAPAERSRVIPYGVNPELFRPDEAGGREIRRRLGLKQDEIVVLAIGRLVYKKGFEYLIRALPPIREAGAPITLVVAGSGDLAEELEGLAKNLGVADQVRFPGSVQRGDVPAFFGMADIFALPSVVDQSGNVDGLPNVLLEAMASSKAIVASRVAGVPDVIEEDISGLLVEEKNPEKLAAAILRLVEFPGLRVKLGAAARAKVEGELNWPAVARRFEEAFRSAAGAVS